MGPLAVIGGCWKAARWEERLPAGQQTVVSRKQLGCTWDSLRTTVGGVLDELDPLIKLSRPTFELAAGDCLQNSLQNNFQNNFQNNCRAARLAIWRPNST